MSGQAWFTLLLVVVNGVILAWGWAVARRPLAPGALLADRARQVRRRQAAPWVAAFELLLIARFVLLLRSQ